MEYPSDKDLAAYCELAYECETVVSGEVEILIRQFTDYQIIAHRGTESKNLIAEGGWLDWINNIRHLPPWYDKRTGWVHPGYLKTVRKALPHIIPYLDKTKAVFITGHSKGGGEAPILAQLLIAEGYDVEQCVTFGAPRVVMFFSHKKYPCIIFRDYRNGSDIVTAVPTRYSGYRHPGRRIQLGEKYSHLKLSCSKYHAIGKYIEKL